MSSALVTGAAGFIGKHLVRHLAQQGIEVSGIDFSSAEEAGLAQCVSAWEANGLSLQSLESVRAQIGLPKVVYHLAGGSSVGASLDNPLADFDATVRCTAVLLEWLRSCTPMPHLIIVSSAAVYGNIHSKPISEHGRTAPYSPYGAHKYAMETTVKGWSSSFGIPAVAVRLFSVYGPGLRKQLLWDLSNRLHENDKPILLGGSGNELRDWTHVDDVTRALQAASGLTRVGMPVVNAGSMVGSSVREVSCALASAFGEDPERIKFSGQGRPGDPLRLVAAPGRLAAAEFQWGTDLKKGLTSYAEWYRKAVRL